MMGNVIKGGVADAAQAGQLPPVAASVPGVPASSAEGSEASFQFDRDHGNDSDRSLRDGIRSGSARSKSLESLSRASSRGEGPTLGGIKTSKSSESLSPKNPSNGFVSNTSTEESRERKTNADGKRETTSENKSSSPTAATTTITRPTATSSTTTSSSALTTATTEADEKISLASILSSLPSDSADSYHTASESTEGGVFEEIGNRLPSRHSPVFDRESPPVDRPQTGEDDSPSGSTGPRRDKTSRLLLGRAFSCDGSGLRADPTAEDSDETESERGQSSAGIGGSASTAELSLAESDDEVEDKTLVVDEGVASAVDASDDELDGVDSVLRNDDDGDDNDAGAADGNRRPSNPQTSSNAGDSIGEEKGAPGRPAVVTSVQAEDACSGKGGDDDEASSKPFVVDALKVDPSSAASEQVLENLESSSSQPSFDDPAEAREEASSVFVFPDGKAGMPRKENCDALEESDDDEFVEKMPMSPLVRIGSRIIDKRTKTIRGRPRSYHSSGLHSEIKEEIFTEMGFAQDQQGQESREKVQFIDPVVIHKPRVPFKSIQVQSLVEMDEEEAEDKGTLERNKNSSVRGCRPKSFPSVSFVEGTEFGELNLNSEEVKKVPDILNKSSESGYLSGSYSQSPPPRSLTATPSLTTPSALIQPNPTQQNVSDPPINHFETCKGEHYRRADEHGHPEKFKVILRRDPQGYGIRTGGNKPVTILSVVEGSVAARNGLKARDVIFMLNGTNVSQYDHESVSNLFKASRTYMEIVVLRHVDFRSDSSKAVSNQIEFLKRHPALMACFLLDLTLHNRQNSLFFSMAAYLLRQKDTGDSNFQRWAYEIFSTFLDQHAPLKLQHGLEVPSISGLLSSDEASIRQSYDSVDNFLQLTIKKQLTDYLKNTGLVHEFELRNMEHLKQMKHIEKVLWKSFETLSSEEKDDKKQALAASMATFFHLVGFSSIRGGNLLESFPSFVSTKMPNKVKKSKGHVFRTEYITNLSPCGVCKHPTWNLGTTVYKCSSCSFFVHSYCLFKLTEACNFKRKTNSFVPFYVVDDPNSSFDLSKNYAGLFRSRSCQLSSKSAFIGDPDLDIPLDLPHLKDIIPHEELKKLKNKELKFQEIINELFHTEKLHVRSLKIMKMLYERPMRAESSISNITNLLFPNLDELIRVHDILNFEFDKCREEQKVVTRIGGVLVSLFSGTRGDHLKKASAMFCKDQSYSLFTLRKNLRKEKLAQIIQEAALNPYSGRLSLKDFLPKEMQRITKYPLLIDGLINNTPVNSEEYLKLQEASKLSRNILRYVDCQVRDCENGRKLMDLQMRLDARQLENSTDPNVIPYRKLNLIKKKLIMDGELVWKYKRAGGSKTQDLHVVLCEDMLLLLVKQEGRLVLKCHTTTIEDHVYVYYPVLRLSGLLTKDAGRDKCAFFIVDRNSPQVYHLAAKNKELRNRWFNVIAETVNNLARSLPASAGAASGSSHSTAASFSTNQKREKHVKSTIENVGGKVQEFKDSEVSSSSCPRRDSAPSLLGSFMKGTLKRKLPTTPSKSLDVRSPSDEERRISRPANLPLRFFRSLSSAPPTSPLSSSSLSLPQVLQNVETSMLDNLRSNILIVDSLLQQKISILKEANLRSGLQDHHHHHNLRRPLSLVPNHDYNSIGGGAGLDHLSSSTSPLCNGNGFDNGCCSDDDNVKLLSSLADMSEKEVVSFCLPQVEAIQRLIEDPCRYLPREGSAVSNHVSNDQRHLQQFLHWRMQGLRLKNLGQEAVQSQTPPSSSDPRNLSGASFSSAHSRENDNNNNSNSLINSPSTPISLPAYSSVPIQQDIFSAYQHQNSHTLSKLVTLKTRIELALSQLVVQKFKEESIVVEHSSLPISS